MISIEQFNDQLDKHGADLDSWPNEMRTHARELLEHNDEARAALVEDESVSALLASIMRVPESNSLRAKILRGVLNREGEYGFLDSFVTSVWRMTTVAAVPLIIGLYVGAMQQENYSLLEDELTVMTFLDYDVALLVANE